LNRKHLLQLAVAAGGVVPVAAGGAGVLLGPRMADALSVGSADLDSHFRYLSGLLLGIGLGFWATIPDIDRRGGFFRLLAAIVFVGGLGRLCSAIAVGAPGGPMLFGLAMELVVTPALAVWQYRVARGQA
jgi:hypothetical protein